MLIVLFCRQLYRVMYNLLCLQCRTLFIIVLLLGSFAILVYEHCVIIQAVKPVIVVFLVRTLWDYTVVKQCIVVFPDQGKTLVIVCFFV